MKKMHHVRTRIVVWNISSEHITFEAYKYDTGNVIDNELCKCDLNKLTQNGAQWQTFLYSINQGPIDALSNSQFLRNYL